MLYHLPETRMPLKRPRDLCPTCYIGRTPGWNDVHCHLSFKP